MNSKIEEGIQEILKDALEGALHAIQYNLNNVLGGALYGLKLEMEKEPGKKGVGVIDCIVNTIIATSRYEGPEGEQWPTWAGGDRHPSLQGKQANEALDILTKHLRRHGICQHTNLSKLFPLTPGVTEKELAAQVKVLETSLKSARKAQAMLAKKGKK